MLVVSSQRDLVPVALVIKIPTMIVAGLDTPIGNLQAMIDYAKANPGKLSYGSFGTGTYAHLSMEDLKQRTGMDIQHVPYGAQPLD